MRKLFREMQSGEISAREKLVNGNLRLVLSVIKDLITEENMLTIYFKLVASDL